MELLHPLGWHVLPLPLAGSDGRCMRLCSGRSWVGDYRFDDLVVRLRTYGLEFDHFTARPDARCPMIDAEQGLVCLCPAERTTVLPAGGLVPLCERCDEILRLGGDGDAGPVFRPAVPFPWQVGGVGGVGDDVAGAALLATGLPAGESVSHRVRSAATKILGYAELLDEDRAALSPVHVQRVQAIHRAASDIRSLLTGPG